MQGAAHREGRVFTVGLVAVVAGMRVRVARVFVSVMMMTEVVMMRRRKTGQFEILVRNGEQPRRDEEQRDDVPAEGQRWDEWPFFRPAQASNRPRGRRAHGPFHPRAASRRSSSARSGETALSGNGDTQLVLISQST